MTRPPRPKYPSDLRNYHEIRKPGFAHTVRLPEELLETYEKLKRAMGPKTTHADALRFIFEAAESAIQAVVQAAEPIVMGDSQHSGLGNVSFDTPMDNFEEDPGAESPLDASDSDDDNEPPIVWDFTGEGDDVVCGDSQIPTCNSEPQALRQYADATYGFWSKVKVLDFFLKFPVMCPIEGCMRKFLPPKVVEFQQVWSISMKCPVDHTFAFLTGELETERGVPDITGKFYHSALCSGMTHSCLEAMCEEVGLHVPRRAHFFDFQSGKRRNIGWIAAALDLWETEKKRLQQDLLQAGKPLVLYVDCRFDSSRSAFHGTLPVINMADDKLRDFCKDNGLPSSGNKLQLVQRVSVHLKLPEAGASTSIQRTRPLRYPELAQHDLAYKLKSWIYTCAKNAARRGDSDPKVLTLDIQNAANHWAGNHATCRTLPGTRKCVIENWDASSERKYAEGGETHIAVKDFLKKYITESKMKFYIRARENFMSETFHSVINKFATKRIHFDSSHTARLACAAMDWNENIRREVRAVYNQVSNDTAVRRRARTNKVLCHRTSVWKFNIARRVFG
ncbi:hypothetical protein R1sor_026853 [Riccia sorocarpa]|uniref:SAP domain-containing protein n=1 Tax=Riccia sorocarpa TaxID=122646 RepID=A0ABD3GCM0_9MARC